MPIADFPPIDETDEHGLLAIGGDLHPESLLLAYRRGIFPWPISEEYPLAWFAPDPRGVLDVSDLNISKRLERYFNKLDVTITYNQAFREVVSSCAQVTRKGQSDTWITKDIMDGYHKLFTLGYAYSVEAWQDQQLIAGVYGTCIEGVASGESMFTHVDHASKYCLTVLMNKLSMAGISWLDTQMVSPVVASLGGKEITRDHFMERLENAPKDLTVQGVF